MALSDTRNELIAQHRQAQADELSALERAVRLLQDVRHATDATEQSIAATIAGERLSPGEMGISSLRSAVGEVQRMLAAFDNANSRRLCMGQALAILGE